MKISSIDIAHQLFEALGNPIRLRVLNILVQHGVVLNVDLTNLFEYKNHIRVKRHLDYMVERNFLVVESLNNYFTTYFLSDYLIVFDYFLKKIEDKQFKKDLRKYRNMDLRISKILPDIQKQPSIRMLTDKQKKNNLLLK